MIVVYKFATPFQRQKNARIHLTKSMIFWCQNIVEPAQAVNAPDLLYIIYWVWGTTIGHHSINQ